MFRARHLIPLVSLLVVVAVAVGVVACGKEEPSSGTPGGANMTALTIYSSAPLRGKDRALAQSVVNGQRLALSAVQGRVGPFTIKFKSLDDTTDDSGGWDARQTAANARAAARDRSTIAYLGELDSGASAISVPILNEVGILQVSPTTTAVGLTRGGGAEKGEPDKYYPATRRTFGRVIPADDLQAGVQVGLQRERGCRSTFVLDDGDVYGVSLGALVAARAQRAGLQVAGRTSVEADGSRNREVAAQVKASDVDCVFFAGTMVRADDLFNDIAREVPTVRLFASGGLANARFARALDHAAAARTLVTTPALPLSSYSAAGRRFVQRYQAAFGREPDPYAIYGYESMAIVLQAIHDAGDRGNNRDAVIDAFYKIRNHASALGRYSIDDKGDTSLSTYSVQRVVDGRLVALSTVKAKRGD